MRLVPSSVRPLFLMLAIGAARALTASAAAAQAAPAAPSAEPAPAPPIIRPYALIKPTIIFAGKPVESFSQPNASAGTAAGNPVIATLPGSPQGTLNEEASLTFQAAQSRLGFWFAEKSPVRGQFELDFIDFTKSSPTTAALPRLRIAKVEWALSDSTTLIAGQDWDLFQPVNPYTVDIVAVAFQAGNTAFMREQAKLIYKTESLELGAAIGLAGVNNAAKAAVPEYARIPSFAARAALVVGGTGRIGVSAIATSWRFAPDQAAERKALAGAVGLYGDVTPVEGFNLRFELYGGQNLANMGSLSLGNGNAVNDIKEIGGFLSGKYSFTPTHALYFLAGHARVLNDEDVVPSYGYGAIAMGAPAPAESAATITAGAGPGMTENTTGRLGYEYRYDKTVGVLLEGFMFKSKHVLEPTYDADIDGDVTSFGGELGILFTL